MKNRVAHLAQPAHSAQTGADEAAIDAQPLIPLQLCKVAKSVNSGNGNGNGNGNDLASAPEQPFRSTLVDAVVEHLRVARMKRFRPH